MCRPIVTSLILLALAACRPGAADTTPQDDTVQPVYITQPVRHDTDDPAVWIHPTDPAQSLIIGTDKDVDGALYVYNLQGQIQEELVVRNLRRPNNVDVEYGLPLGGDTIDIAVATERLAHALRIFRLPDMQPVDGGGIPVFAGETGPKYQDPMGVALYREPVSGAIYAIVGRKNGPTDGTYLWQYHLTDDGQGQVQATLVRKFGAFSGTKEIEAIAVDDSLGYVYYADERAGVRKYYAHPDSSGVELAFFAQTGYAEDREGISLYCLPGGEGYILVSDQGANTFHFYPRAGAPGDPHRHDEVRVVRTATQESDGSETISLPLGPDFPRGLFVAMSTDKTFHLYRWEDIAGEKPEAEVR